MHDGDEGGGGGGDGDGEPCHPCWMASRERESARREKLLIWDACCCGECGRQAWVLVPTSGRRDDGRAGGVGICFLGRGLK
jgi:hypothetical protein